MSALSCNFEFVVGGWWVVAGFQRLRSPNNTTTVLVVLLLGLWLLLGCDNSPRRSFEPETVYERHNFILQS